MSCCNKSDSISPIEREYYQALSKRAGIQEELASKLAEERKNGATPSLTREIDAKRSELRVLQVRIEALDVKLQKEKNAHS